MTDLEAPAREDRRPKPVAPYRHTFILVALFLLITVAGAIFQGGGKPSPGGSVQHPPVAPLYLSLIALEWGLVLSVWRGGLRRGGTTMGKTLRR